NVSNLGLAKIRDNVPLAGVEQREDGNPRGNMCASRDVEIDDASGKGCNDLAVRQMKFFKVDRRHHAIALSLQSGYRGSGLVDGFCGGKTVGQERFQAVQRVLGLCDL